MRSQTNFFTLLCLFALLVIAPLGCSDDSDATNNKRPQTPETCGNGQLDEGEVCDGEQLGGETCESQGATGGQLGCKSTCLGFELTQCSAPATCGDDTIQSPEVCDGSDLAGASCESLGFDRGTLTCANNCLEVNSSGCSYEGECQPTTCADVGAQCGSIDNGCGETLNCGGCDGDLSCGGSGEENICGATCPQGCPDGFSCNTLGVCTGDSDTIAVNMPTATVELVAQVDGQAPQPSSQCGSNTSYRLGYIKLVSISNGEEEEYDIPCNGSLEVAVPKDTYRVSIQGAHSTDLLRREFQTHANLVVDSDMTITANMPTATVQLVAQLNGQAPQPSSQCSGGDAYQLADITLVSLTNGEVEEYGVDCDGTLEVKIPKDTYRVSVEGRFSSDLLRRDFQTHANLVVDSDMTITANMPTATVQLVAQLNGQAPQPSSQCADDAYQLADITLTSLTNGEVKEYGVDCDGTLEVEIPKDTYRVSVEGRYSSDLLRRDFQTHANLVVDADMTITANMPTATVQLVAQLNGQAPQPSSQCADDAYQLADITLTSLTNGEVKEYGVDCDGTLEVEIPKDTYRVSVEGRYSSDLLRRDFQTHANLVVDADMTITANMPTATVQLVAQLNGQAPQPSSQCADDAYQLADITLTSLTNGEVKEYGVDCAGTLEVEIPKDTYRVSVEGRYSSDLLRRDFQTHANLVVDADMTITANMPTATVQLVAQLNGQAPQPSSQCADDAYQLADITLTSLTNGEVEEYGVDCDGTLEVEIPKDTYAVSIEGRSSSDLLRQEYLAIQRIELN